MRYQVVVAAAIAAMLTGCQTPQPRTTQFVEAEFAPYDGAGSGVVTGQAFLVTRGGDVKYAAGREILCAPANTSYSTEFYERYIVGYTPLQDGDPRANKYVRRATGDGSGRFRFDGLPAGEYFVWSNITWEYANGVNYAGVTTSNTGGIAHARVTVKDGQTTEVLVTRN